MTFLLAKAHGKPLRLLPAVLWARFQHPYLVHDAARGALAPEALNGTRIGLRSYSVTTAAWVRGFLASDRGVDHAVVGKGQRFREIVGRRGKHRGHGVFSEVYVALLPGCGKSPGEGRVLAKE